MTDSWVRDNIFAQHFRGGYFTRGMTAPSTCFPFADDFAIRDSVFVSRTFLFVAIVPPLNFSLAPQILHPQIQIL